MNHNRSHTFLRFAEPIAEDLASRMILEITKIDRVRSIGESDAQLDHLLAHLPPLATRVVTDAGPAFTLRGIALDTWRAVYKLAAGNTVQEIRVTAVNGGIGVGGLSW